MRPRSKNRQVVRPRIGVKHLLLICSNGGFMKPKFCLTAGVCDPC